MNETHSIKTSSPNSSIELSSWKPHTHPKWRLRVPVTEGMHTYSAHARTHTCALFFTPFSFCLISKHTFALMQLPAEMGCHHEPSVILQGHYYCHTNNGGCVYSAVCDCSSKKNFSITRSPWAIIKQQLWHENQRKAVLLNAAQKSDCYLSAEQKQGRGRKKNLDNVFSKHYCTTRGIFTIKQAPIRTLPLRSIWLETEFGVSVSD